MVGHSRNNSEASVANLSLGGSFSQALNDAVAAAFAANITMVVAAGNDDSNACQYSPAAEPSALTVGASDTSDSRASYSNYGVCVDLFGPGSSITSAWIGYPSARMVLSGTSMAAPHVAGVAALLLSTAAANNYTLNSSEVSSRVISTATKDALTNTNGTRIILDPSPLDISPNLLAYTPPCGNSSTSSDNSGSDGVFSSTKSSFRFFVLLFLAIYSVETGMIVQLDTLKRYLWQERGVVPPLLNQILFLPAATLLVVIALGQELIAYYDIGLLLVAIAPCGIMSNTVIQLCRLNVHMSVSCTYAAHVGSFLIVPPLLGVYLRIVFPMQHHDTTCSFQRLYVAVGIMMLGSIVGVLLAKATDNMITRCVAWIISIASAVVFSISLGLAMVAYGSHVASAPLSVWVTCMLLQVLGIIGALASAQCLTKSSLLNGISLALDSTFKNFMLPLAIIAFSLHSPHKNKIMTVPLIYGITILLNMLWLIPALCIFVKMYVKSNHNLTSSTTSSQPGVSTASEDGAVMGPIAAIVSPPSTALAVMATPLRGSTRSSGNIPLTEALIDSDPTAY